MKHIIIIFAVTIIFALGNSCSDLDLAPISSMTTGSMWRSTDDAVGAKYGMYDLFREAFADNYQWYTELRTGYYIFGTTYVDLYRPHLDNQLDPGTLGSDWQDFYTLINHTNLILKYVPQINFNDEDIQNQILAEAHFMRALVYFWLVRIWGDVPVLTVPLESDKQSELYPNRNPVSEVYELIKEDLSEAESLYPEDHIQPKYLVNKSAIKMLITDVYLWLYKVENESGALEKAEEGVNNVLSNTSYNLEPVFRDIFRNESNSENIFTIYREDEESGESWFGLTIYRKIDVPKELQNNPVPVGNDQKFAYSDLAWEIFHEDDNDQRAKETIDSLHTSTRLFMWGEKYSGDYIGKRRFDQNQHVYRFAEALLFKAEIENEKGNATASVSYLNKIAERAYGVADYYSSTLSKDKIDEAILNERAKEFFFEGRYWWDLIRFDKVFKEVPNLVGRENEQNVLLWPVSYNTINRNNKIEQTPGYY